MRRKTLQILGVIALAVAFLAGLTYILQRHAQQAESYPTLSSFRTLPEGTSIFYEALRRTPGMTTQRNTLPLGSVHFNQAAILLLGYQPTSLAGNGQWFSDIEEMAGAGNRVIIGFLPHRNRFIESDKRQLETALQRWSVSLAFVKETDMREDKEDELVAGWPMYFSKSAGWQITRKEDGRAVVIERPSGKGSIVLLANPYLLSNAAMVDDRQTTFLAGIIGPMHQAVFDETHFGIEETGSIAALARRYRLQGLILGLVLTSCLFIWKSAAGFPPPWGGTQPAKSVLGEDSAAAFLNLLRRNIKREDILATCVDAWGKMNARKAAGKLRTAIDLAESGRKTPVQTYAQIQNILGAKHN